MRLFSIRAWKTAALAVRRATAKAPQLSPERRYVPHAYRLFCCGAGCLKLENHNFKAVNCYEYKARELWKTAGIEALFTARVPELTCASIFFPVVFCNFCQYAILSLAGAALAVAVALSRSRDQDHGPSAQVTLRIIQ